jgi:hypothetical protein
MNQQVVSRYHNDLLGAILAQVPIDFGSVSGAAGSSLGGRADRKKLERLGERTGEPESLPKAYLAGLRLYERNAAADVVLDGLSWEAHSRSQISMVVSRTVQYMLVLAAVAVAGIAFHHVMVAPIIDSFHKDLAIDQAGGFAVEVEPAANESGLDQMQAVAGLIAVVAFLALSLMILVGPDNVVRQFGGKQFQSDRACLASARAAQELIANQVKKDEAIQIAGDLVGNFPGITSKLTAAVESLDDSDEICDRLDSLATYFRASASDRLAVMHSFVPTMMIVLIGGLVALAYGVAVFYPLVNLLDRLAGTL